MSPSLPARADAGVTPLALLLDTTVLNNFIKIGRLPSFDSSSLPPSASQLRFSMN